MPQWLGRLKQVWQSGMGEDRVTAFEAEGMGAEDFPFFTTDPEITSVYFSVGGTDADYITQQPKMVPDLQCLHTTAQYLKSNLNQQ